jgi:4-hydroxybenzoate polyprenyltransferase
MRLVFYMFRIPNLLIIAITFLMLRYLVFVPVYSAFSLTPGMSGPTFLLMVILTVIIAAAGYVSNDYFDRVTDRINKPDKQYIGRQISPGMALAISLMLNFVALAGSIVLSNALKNGLPAILLITALLVTWWYAIHLKKSLLWGNIAVSSMSAGTIVMAWLIENQCAQLPAEPAKIITRIIIAVGTFAFLLSLVREIIKDMEDMEGDWIIGCKSLPIYMGIPFTKSILLLLTVFTLALLVLTQMYLFQYHKIFAVLWLLTCVEIPLVYFAFALRKSDKKTDFHRLSTLLKMIMLGGILTLVAGQL